MESIRITQPEMDIVNEQRAALAVIMMESGRAETPLIAIPGPCSPDLNRLPHGELTVVRHGLELARAAARAEHSTLYVRDVAEKPRTTTGFTGIIHEPGGAWAYIDGARQLHQAGVPIASEVMSDAGAIIAVPHLALGWVGAREVAATGPRYNVRPTDRDLDCGVHPLPTFVKNDQDGDLGHTINALYTIVSDRPQTRTRFGLDGYEEVVTRGNPHVGVILRGSTQRPDGAIEEVLAEEIGTARELLDHEFGKDRVPIVVDVSHAHAKCEGGGEQGQLRVAAALGSLMGISRIDGWMAETYILPDKQSADGTIPGLSVTDPCIREEYAKELILDMDRAKATARELLAV